jgi:hypothetical protein
VPGDSPLSRMRGKQSHSSEFPILPNWGAGNWWSRVMKLRLRLSRNGEQEPRESRAMDAGNAREHSSRHLDMRKPQQMTNCWGLH